jgi:hypothetical protein
MPPLMIDETRYHHLVAALGSADTHPPGPEVPLTNAEKEAIVRALEERHTGRASVKNPA